MPEIIVGLNPLDPTSVKRYPVAAGGKLSERESRLPRLPYIVFRNGFDEKHIMLQADRRDYRLQAGDRVVYMPQLAGGGGSNPLKVILSVALIAFAAPIAGFLSGVTGITAFTSAMVARFGAAMLVSAFVQPQPVNANGLADIRQASPTYSVTAQGNVARLNAPVPKIYGSHVVFPVYAAAPYTFYDGNQQYLDQVFLIGHGRYATQEPKLEDSPISSFTKVDWAYLYYDVTGALTVGDSGNGIGWQSWLDDKAHRMVTSREVSGQELLGTNETGYDWVGPFVLNKAGTEVSAIYLDMVCPRGLYYAQDNGDFTSKTVSWTFEAQQVDDQGTALGSWFPVTVNQNLSGSSSVETSIPQNQSDSYQTKVVRWVEIDTGVSGTSNWQVDQASGRAANVMSFYVTNSGNNDIIHAEVEAYWQYNYNDFNDTDTWESWYWRGDIKFKFDYSYAAPATTPSLTAATNEAQQVTYAAKVAPGRYQVRGKRTDSKDTSARAGHELRWAGLRGVLTKNPLYADVTLLFCRFAATDQLSQQASRKVNCVVMSYLPTWDKAAQAWNDPLPTRNPYWVMADIIRAGYGGDVADSHIDLDGLADLAADADVRGDYFDYVADQRSTVWDALQLVGRTCRTSPSRVAGKLYFVKDVAREYPVAVFSSNQIVKGSFSVERMMPDRRTTSWIEAEFFNRDTWSWDTVRVGTRPDDPAALPLQIKLDGVTTAAQAQREALYMTAVNNYRRQFVTFQAEMDGNLPTYGDLVLVSHELPEWGQNSYVVAYDAATRTVTLANEMNWGGTDFLLAFRLADGSLSDTYGATQGAGGNLVVLDADAPANLKWYGHDPEPTTVVFGQSSVWARSCLVVSAKPKSLERVEITCVLDNPDVYEDYPWSPGLPVADGDWRTYTVPAGVYRIEVVMRAAVKGESAWRVWQDYDGFGNLVCYEGYVDPNYSGGAESTVIELNNDNFPSIYPELLPADYGADPAVLVESFDVMPGQTFRYWVGKKGVGMASPPFVGACPNLYPRRGDDGENGMIQVRAVNI